MDNMTKAVLTEMQALELGKILDKGHRIQKIVIQSELSETGLIREVVGMEMSDKVAIEDELL